MTTGVGAEQHRSWRTLVPPACLAGLFLTGWLAASYVVLDERRRFLLPPPQEVLAVGFGDGANREALLDALWGSATVALAGLALATLVGVTVAVAMSQARWLESSLWPYAVLLQTIPVLALVPLIGFWWGFDFRSRVLVCVLISLFPIINTTLFGLKSVPSELHDLFTLYRARRLVRLVRLQLPHALPAIVTGIRTSAGLSVIGAIVGDYFFRQGEPGLGRLLDVYRANLQSEQLFATVLAASALGIAMFTVFGRLGHLLTRRWFDPVHDRPQR